MTALPREALVRLAREAGLLERRRVKDAIFIVRAVLSDEPSSHVLPHAEAMELRARARALTARLPASQRVVDARSFGAVLDELDGETR